MTEEPVLPIPAVVAVPRRESYRFMLMVMAAAAVLIAAVAWLALLGSRLQQRELEATRMEAIADLRASQVSSWLREKTDQVSFAGNSVLSESYGRWIDTGDMAQRALLLDRMASFLKITGGAAVLVMDNQGQVVASDPPGVGAQAPAPLVEAARRAIAKGTVQFTDFYGERGPVPAPRLDIVAPLALSGQQARGVVVLRLDPRDYLIPLINRWPLPSRTASAQLVRQVGGFLVGPFGRSPIPVSAPEVLVARVVRGEAPLDRAVDALDFRGEPVMGVVRQVEGTAWLLTTRMARSEIESDSLIEGRWIIAAGVLAWLATGALAWLLRERLALRLARQEQARQDIARQRLEELVALRTCELAGKNLTLARTVADLETFSATVSHDLRGPLRTISGFATLLDRNEGERLTDEGRRKLGRIVAGANTMDRMIGDILACSRAELMPMHLASVDLDQLVASVLQELQPNYPATRIEAGPLPVVRADPTMAWQVFANLLGNALKFSSKQAQPLVEIGVRETAGGPRLFVQDNGVGFDSAQADRLFAPFQRLDTAGDYPGSGVGLSIVRRLLERHGGGIDAYSMPGRTVFTFTFGPQAA